MSAPPRIQLEHPDEAPEPAQAATEVGIVEQEDVSPVIRGVVYAVLALFVAVICFLALVVLWRLA